MDSYNFDINIKQTEVPEVQCGTRRPKQRNSNVQMATFFKQADRLKKMQRLTTSIKRDITRAYEEDENLTHGISRLPETFLECTLQLDVQSLKS